MIIYLILGILVQTIMAEYDCKNLQNVLVRNVTINDISEDIIDSVFIKDVEGANVDDSAYIQANVINSYLIIRTTSYSQEYNEGKVYTATVLVKCPENNYRLEYNIKFESTVCYGILFNNPECNYRRYALLPKGTKIDLLATSRISVRCNIGPVRFGILKNEYFIIEYEESITLTVIQDVRPLFNDTFTILAWDDIITKDNPATTLVRFEVISNVAFKESIYYGYINSDFNVIINNGPITLKTDVSMDYIGTVIFSEYGAFFDINHSDYEILLEINIKNELPGENDIINFDVQAYDVRYPLYGGTTLVELDVSLIRKGPDNVFLTTDILTTEETSIESTSTEETTTATLSRPPRRPGRRGSYAEITTLAIILMVVMFCAIIIVSIIVYYWKGCGNTKSDVATL